MRLEGRNRFRIQEKYGRKIVSYTEPPNLRRGQKVTLKIPKVFCLLTEPESALVFIEKLNRVLANPAVRLVHLDHKDCTELGLDASVLMDTMLLDAKAKRAARGPRLFLSGTHPRDLAVKSMIRQAGILQSIRHPESRLPSPPDLTTITCPLMTGNAKRPEASWARDTAGTRIIEYFQECLSVHDVELTSEGITHFADLVTEVLGNAEEHGGNWFAIGYYAQRHDSDTGMCHLVLFNKGQSIFESMSAPEASPEIKSRAASLAATHMNRGLFGLGPRKAWDIETLWTLYALQEGVSSKLHQRPSRGNGSVEVIRAFSQLSGAGRRMCILSGRSYILFNGQYDLAEQDFGNQSRKVLAFNPSNDLEQAPDPKYVRALQKRYQGTVVSLRFTLEGAHLKRLAGENV